MEVNRELVTNLLIELCQPTAIIERSDLHSRRLEAMPERAGCIYGPCPASVAICGNGLQFSVDLLEGQ